MLNKTLMVLALMPVLSNLAVATHNPLDDQDVVTAQQNASTRSETPYMLLNISGTQHKMYLSKPYTWYPPQETLMQRCISVLLQPVIQELLPQRLHETIVVGKHPSKTLSDLMSGTNIYAAPVLLHEMRESNIAPEVKTVIGKALLDYVPRFESQETEKAQEVQAASSS